MGRDVLHPTSPEGKYWFTRHNALISVFKSLAESDCVEVANMSKEILETEIMLDIEQIQEMKSELAPDQNNLIIVDEFKTRPKDGKSH